MVPFRRIQWAFATYILLFSIYMGIRTSSWTLCAVAVAPLALMIAHLLTSLRAAIGNIAGPTVFDDAENCKAVLTCTLRAQDRKPSLSSMLEARAIPNGRLQFAFGIDNAFTTTDMDWYKAFRRLSEAHLRISPSHWQNLATTARRIAASSTSSEAPCSVSLTPFIQLLTLKLSLHIFFDLDPTTLGDAGTQLIATRINHIWITSKSPETTTPWSDQHELHAALRTAIPHCHPLTPRENPMNLILPSYETMWRVVLRCVLELRFRPHLHDARNSRQWRAAMAAYLRSPIASVFNEAIGDGELGPLISPAAVAKEALRLYPPTRRVYRDLPQGVGGEAGRVRVAADVEALHRDGGVWPSSEGVETDAKRFWPGRWMGGVGGEGTGVPGQFLAFGGARFACPASAAFGPMMVGLLVAVVLEVLGEEGEEGVFEVEDECMDEMGGVEPLMSDREAYGGFRVMRRG